jgi:copper chaperone
MEHVIEVENIRCGGCANTITHSLQKLDGVSDVSVDIENGRVTVTAATDDRERLVANLLKNGYPEKGSAEGLQAAKAKAKSFVSCAIGKLG